MRLKQLQMVVRGIAWTPPGLKHGATVGTERARQAGPVAHHHGIGRTLRRTRERDRFIDEIDRRIIARLELDARVTNQALAQAVMLSPSACLQRVRRLEQNGIIKRYIADIDEAELDCLIFHAELLLTAAGRASRKTLEQAFAVRPEILYAAQVCGRADYILKIGGRAPNVWPSLLDEIDPEGRLIAQSSVQTHVRIAKRFGGLSRLSD